MNLAALLSTLAIPEGQNARVFSARPIPKYPNCRIAVDFNGNPSLLLSATNIVGNQRLLNLRLKYLELIQNVECKITDGKKTIFQQFTVLTFICSDIYLQKYFLKAAETLLRSLHLKPTPQEIAENLIKFVEIFRVLTDPPRKSIQGLWAELFLIDNSASPATLLNFWHNVPEQKFDFDSGAEKVEVKSSSSFERIHNFSSGQLYPVEDSRVMIASVFVHATTTGQNVGDLVDSIRKKVGEDSYLSEKLFRLVTSTLGTSFERSLDISFDYSVAKDSLRFYRHEDIKKIPSIHIPKEVSDVRYKSDLTSLDPINPSRIKSEKSLFSGL